jgi:hypothetical protein
MFSALQRQLGTAGLIVAILALVAALGGGAYAATGGGAGASKSKPKGLTKAQVLALIKQNQTTGLAGPAGAIGPAGVPGPAGTTGKEGTTGPAGPFLEVLPSGKTLKGEWGTGGGIEGGGLEPTFGTAVATVSFSFPLSSAPTLNYIFKEPEGGGSVFGLSLSGSGVIGVLTESEAKANCPGSAGEPNAKAGNLCLYANQETLQEAKSPFSQAAWAGSKYDQPTKFGANVAFRFFETEGTVAGTWAVTAK